MKQYIVDAFVADDCEGNPAAVCVLEDELSEDVMQQIAKQNQLSETAFVRKCGDRYALRWFTPGCEVSLCGHATLATTAVLATYYEQDIPVFKYETLSGIICVEKKGDWYELNLPKQVIKSKGLTKDILEAIGKKPKDIYQTCDVVCVLEDEKEVYDFCPDYALIAQIKEGEGLIITASSAEYDFVSRCFYPKEAINEDPVTGSAHCSLVPYWEEQLGKNNFIAYQASERGGVLRCQSREETVLVCGMARIRA